MNWNATCAARIAHRSVAMPTSGAIWSRCGQPRFQPVIRRQRGGRASADECYSSTLHFSHVISTACKHQSELFFGLLYTTKCSCQTTAHLPSCACLLVAIKSFFGTNCACTEIYGDTTGYFLIYFRYLLVALNRLRRPSPRAKPRS